MTRTKSTFLALLAALLSPMVANADLFEFSYDTGGGVLTFDFEGTVLGDNDTIEVLDILGAVQVDGIDAFALPFVGLFSGYSGTFTGVGAGIMSLSGSTMDILACDTDGCSRGFFISTDLGLYSTGGLGRPGDYVADNLRIRAVPEPGTLALLGIGLLGLGAARRKKA